MRNSETFAALQYKCVGGFPGVYYLVKIYVGNDECVHAMLSLSSEESNGLNVFAVKGYMRRDDELEPLKIELPEK
uniref:Cystatin domain-containing protein n=1 Tax=Octopus bimaculoides TaxID=37653 RepID=A0A0L8G6I9_OCTBM